MTKLLVWLALAAACSEPTGALLVVDGSVKFDQVQFYFGDIAGERIPTTPLRPMRLLGESQLLLHRRFVPDDAPAMSSARTTWSYLVPAAGENIELGAYTLVVASLAGVPVGIGELFDFEVPTGNVIHRYTIGLVPIADQDFERWDAPRTIAYGGLAIAAPAGPVRSRW